MSRVASFAIAAAIGLFAPSISADEFRDSVPVESGGSLTVELDSGSVEIETHGDLEVSVEASARGWGGNAMRFRLEGDGADARLTGKRRGWNPFGGHRVRVRVRIPEVFSVDVRTGGGSIEIEEVDGSIQARTSGGSIEVEGARGDVEVRTSGGKISIDEVAGDVLARTSGGGIRVSEVAGRVEVRTSGGSIQVHDIAGSVHARTSGGGISARFLDVPEGDLETSGGSIEAEVPEDMGFDLDASTSGGRVRVEHEIALIGEIDSSRVTGRINGGGPKLRLKTSGGSVRVKVH